MPCSFGYLALKDDCNTTPGAGWYQTVADAKLGIDCLLLANGDTREFHRLYSAAKDKMQEAREKFIADAVADLRRDALGAGREGVTTFLESVRSGAASLDQVDDWIDRWHKGEGEGLELRQFLGMTTPQYAEWMRNPSALMTMVGRRSSMRPG